MSPMGSVDPDFKLHVSFVEADVEFVDKLLVVLGELGRFDFTVTPDGEDHAKDWVDHTGRLIEAADAVAYILSPTSVECPTLAYEAEKARALSKRMVPVVCQPHRRIALPAALVGVRPVRMETRQLFKGNLWGLFRLLDKDAGWTRRHTELYARARKWQSNRHDLAWLLKGAEIIAAKTWTFERPASAPKPTDLHMEFIEASEVAELARLTGQPEDLTQTNEIFVGPSLSPADWPRARRKEKPVAPVETDSADREPEDETPIAAEAIDVAEETSQPDIKPPKPHRKRKTKLLKLRRKSKAAARVTGFDLDTPAYVPISLLAPRALNGHTEPCTTDAETAASPGITKNGAQPANTNDKANGHPDSEVRVAANGATEDVTGPENRLADEAHKA